MDVNFPALNVIETVDCENELGFDASPAEIVVEEPVAMRPCGTEALLDDVPESIDTICFPFAADNATILVGIGGLEFRALVDTGAAVTAVNANVWNKCLSHANPRLDSSPCGNLTSVSGSPLITLGKVLLQFKILPS